MAEPSNTCLKQIGHFWLDVNSSPLGRGAFASVYKVIDDRTNALVAAKVIPSSTLFQSEAHLSLFKREINVLCQLKGEHIAKLLAVKRTEHNLYIFTEYCDGGDLEAKLRAKHNFSEKEACSIISQIADAFVIIQNLPIKNLEGERVTLMHRDIKPANILFHQDKIKVADFGLSKFVENTDPDNNTILGTPLYMSPQLLNGEAYGVKCDIWSTGVLFYELLFGIVPWSGYSSNNLYENIIKKPLAFPREVNDNVKDLLRRMLKVNEEERISWNEVLEHPALKKNN